MASPLTSPPSPNSIQRHSSQSSATSTSNTSSSASFADSENSNDIRASVLNVCIQLGALDDNGRIAEWMFTDPEQPLERGFSQYDEFGASAIHRGRSKIKFGSTASLNGASTATDGVAVPSGSRLVGGDSQRGERETTDDEKEPLSAHQRGAAGGFGSISDRLAATFGFRRAWRNSLSAGASSDTEDGGRNQPIIRSFFTSRSRSHNPSEGSRRPSPPSAHARHLTTSDSHEDRSSTPRPYHYRKGRPASPDDDWEQVASSPEASENNVSGRSMTVRRLKSRPLEYYTKRYQNPTFLPPIVTSSTWSEQGRKSSEPVLPSELGVLLKALQEQQSSHSTTSTNVNSNINNASTKTNATDGTIDTKVTNPLILAPIHSEPQPLLPTPTGPGLGLGLGPIKLESIPEAPSSRFIEGNSTPSMPATPTGIPSSETPWPISGNMNTNVLNINTPQTPTSPTSTSTYSRTRSLAPPAQTQSRFRSRFRSRSRFSLPSMRSATSFALPLPTRSRRSTATSPARPSAPSSPPVLTLMPLPELTLNSLTNPTQGLRSQGSYSQMHLLMGSMSSPNLSSSGLNSFRSPR